MQESIKQVAQDALNARVHSLGAEVFRHYGKKASLRWAMQEMQRIAQKGLRSKEMLDFSNLSANDHMAAYEMFLHTAQDITATPNGCATPDKPEQMLKDYARFYHQRAQSMIAALRSPERVLNKRSKATSMSAPADQFGDAITA